MTASDLPTTVWRATCDALDMAVWLVDEASLRVCYANAASARLLGRPVAQMLGQPVQDLVETLEDQVFWSQPPQELARGIASSTWVLHAASAELVAVQRRVAQLEVPEFGRCFLLSMQERSQEVRFEREMELLLSELRTTLDSAADGVLTYDLQGKMRAFNQRMVSIWQIPSPLLVRRDDAAIQQHMQSQLLDANAYQRHLDALTLDPLAEFAQVLRFRSGQMVEWRCVPQLSKGQPVGRVHVFRDISSQLEAQADLRLAAQVFESSLDGVFIADAEHRLVRLNPSGERLLKIDSQAVALRPAVSLFASWDGREALLPRILETWKSRGFWSGECWLLTADGGRCPVHLSWVVLRDEAGQVYQSIGFVRDLTSQHAAQKRIEELAYRDALTGLPNRLQFREWTLERLGLMQREGGQFAVLFLDLDRFKNVNDSLGHPFGDRVLQVAAQRLQSCLRQADFLCRLGGDEFVVYLESADAAAAATVAQRMLDEVAQPFVLDELSFSIQCSIGVALFPDDGVSLDDLIQHADAAMYRVKERGRGRFGFYQPDMNANLLAHMQLEHAMRQALELGQMQVYYQPQVNLADGRIVGAEALVRWRTPEWGAVSPGVFVPLAEESGYIVTLGAWVMEQAVQQAAGWLQAGWLLPVSVNVSALEFRQPGFVERVTGLLQQYALPASSLVLELTETALLQDAQEMEQILQSLADLGLNLAIDDFGTGYSSLAYLKRLPIHKLKIDKSFVSGLPQDAGDRAIVQAINSMGQAFEVEVIAEGVETPAQRQALLEMGCYCCQGFLYAPALPAEDFSVRLSLQDKQKTPSL